MTRSIKSLSNEQLNARLWKRRIPVTNPRSWRHPDSTFDRAVISLGLSSDMLQKETQFLLEEAMLRLGEPGYRPLRAPTREEVVQLEAGDNVNRSLEQMTTMLRSLPLQYSLANGNVEIFLKNFVGAAWVSLDPNSHGYVMDKAFGHAGNGVAPNPPIDFVAYRERKPQFWMETKCTFAQCGTAAKRCASAALMQAFEYRATIGPELENVPSYIVHFLPTIPSVTDFQLPENLLTTKYGKLGQRCISAQSLIEHYADHGNGQYHSSNSVTVSDKPIVHAVIIRLKPVAATIARNVLNS